MARKHLSCEPKHMRKTRGQGPPVEPDWWFYEERGGLFIVRSPLSQNTEAVVPLRSIRAYLGRLNAK